MTTDVTAVAADGLGPLDGDGAVTRTVLTAAHLQTGTPTGAVDSEAFGLPDRAANPVSTFEGTLTIADAAAVGGFASVKDPYGYASNPQVRHLPDFSATLVQNGSYLIPVERGVQITGSSVWNVALGVGRVWNENADGSLTRAALPFSLIERNANCTHNGLLTFLFSDSQTSQLRYQITSETCEYFQFDMWGQLPVTLAQTSVPEADAVRAAFSDELASRLPTRPLSQLASDYPAAGIDVSAFGAGITPSARTGLGFVYDGVNYVADCPTRAGAHPFCSEVLMPSYSTAKTAFGTLALLRLAQKYGPEVADELITDHIPQAAAKPAWSDVTIRDALDMATGNYTSAGYEVDEAGSTMSNFFLAESEAQKTATALSFPRKSAPGTTWVYHTSDTYLAVQAMQAVLREQEGSTADLFRMLRDEVLIPAGIGADSLTTLRTDNSPAGAAFGCYGLFWTQDSIAKLAQLIGPHRGQADGVQLLHPGLLDAAMQRDTADRGLAVTGVTGMRYNAAVWAKDFSSSDDASFTSEFTVPFMSGFGGITVAMMPNGSTYWVFSDNSEFVWTPAVVQSNRLAPMTGGPTPTPDPDCDLDGVIGNGGFETGSATPWSATHAVVDSRSSLQPPHSGSWKAWLNGFGYGNTDTLSQVVDIPAGCADAALEFWLRITTSETLPIAYDTLKLTVSRQGTTTPLRTWSNLDEQEYTMVRVPLGAYAGSTVTLAFTGTEDYSKTTSFVIDDVRMVES
ncbi:hypothetical protein WDU99_09175 [Microbacterium sp. Mu-80]|uniref:Beta-lactamase-related domain-containing protein n=1 Tax=Microbacterium bandirmense TaxID=3122050 RepID=A0ABU8LAW8_9MICO